MKKQKAHHRYLTIVLALKNIQKDIGKGKIKVTKKYSAQ
jgi:hypothetical protein